MSKHSAQAKSVPANVLAIEEEESARYAICFGLKDDTLITFPPGYQSPFVASLKKMPKSMFVEPDLDPNKFDDPIDYEDELKRLRRLKSGQAVAFKVQYGNVILTGIGQLSVQHHGRRGSPRRWWSINEATLVEINERHMVSQVDETDLYEPIPWSVIEHYRESMKITKEIHYEIEPFVPPADIIVYHPPIVCYSASGTWRYRPDRSLRSIPNILIYIGSNKHQVKQNKEEKFYKLDEYNAPIWNKNVEYLLFAECATKEQAAHLMRLYPLLDHCMK